MRNCVWDVEGEGKGRKRKVPLAKLDRRPRARAGEPAAGKSSSFAPADAPLRPRSEPHSTPLDPATFDDDNSA